MSKKTYKNFKPVLTTKDEFRKFISPVSPDAFKLLTENIRDDGYIRDPLVTWNGIILDGHHRYRIAESLDMAYEVKEMQFDSDNDAKLWMVNNQVGSRRMSSAQLAVLALGVVPLFTELCKERQRKGGTDKENMGKGLKASELAAKKVGINVRYVKDIISINKEARELIELLRTGVYKLALKEATRLKNKSVDGEITTLVIDGALSPKAKIIVDNIRKPKKKKETPPPADSPPADPPPADPLPADPPIDPTTPGITQGSDAETKEKMQALKLQGFLDKLSKETEKSVFKDPAKFLDGRVNTENLMPDFVLEYAKKTGGKYPKNIIIAVPNTELNSDWCQLASSVSSMYCDSAVYAIRFLYFGSERAAFYNSYTDKGLVSIVLNSAPKDKPKSKPKAKAPATITELTPPKTHAAGA